ncbi:MAG TPA: hypothetical protein VF504_04625 [Solirubrobacterales bacterium]|jgi:hypothetical protein
MRKLPILLVLLLLSLSLLAAAASAHAASLPLPVQLVSAQPDDEEAEVADADDEEDDAENEEADADDPEDEGEEVAEADDEGEDCGPGEDELCVEDLAAEEAEDCLLVSANASFTAAPGAGQVRLTVHYRALEPTAVAVDARLRGAKGSVHLGSERVRFHRAGVYREVFDLGSKQMTKAVAARDLEVELHAVGTPADCGMHLATRGPRRAR